MRDERKSKAQLIQELADLRRQVAELQDRRAGWQQARQALQQSEERLRAERDRAQQYLDIAGVIMIALDTAGQVTLINRKGVEVLGYAEEEMLGKNWFDHFVPEAVRAEVRGVFRQLMAGELAPAEYYVNPCITRSGQERLIAWHNTLIADPAGRIVGTLSSGEDITERLQAEAQRDATLRALRQSEERFHSIFDNVSVGMALVSSEGVVLTANRAKCQFLGYSAQELVGMRFAQVTHPEDLDLDQELHAQLFSGERSSYVIDKRYIRKDGQVVWGRLSVAVIHDHQGRPEYAASVCEDITQRKQAEAQRATTLLALQESEEKYRQLFELESDAIFLIESETGRILEANAAATRLYGYSRQELFALKNTDLSAEPDQTRQSVQERQTLVPMRLHRRKDRATFPVEITALHFTWHGRPVYIAAVRDITQRALAEAALQRRNRELTMLNQIIAVSASGLGLEVVLETACRELALTFDMPGAIAALHDETQSSARVVAEYRTESWPTMLNITMPIKDSPVLQRLVALKAPLVIGDARQDSASTMPLDELRQRGIVALLMLPLLVEGNVAGSLNLGAFEPRDFSVDEISLAWNVAGQVAGALAQARLDQRRRQLEVQYHQAQKMEVVGQLTAGIAHEFNNLLTAINGYAELAYLQLMPGDPLREMVERVLHSGRRAAGLVRQLLAFSRRQVIEPRVVSLNGVVADMGRMLQRIIGEPIELVTMLDPELWPVRVDPAQIEQVIINLVVNARDAMPSGGQLSVETANVVLDETYAASHLEVEPGDYVLLAVSDTGVGMSEEVRAHIFEPFFTTKAPGQGTGLGLATVYGVVKQSGGHVWVYSEEGKGSTFKIYLPRVREELEPAAGARGVGDMPTGQETILLVEDDESVRDLARRLLRGQGYTVLEARNGQEALLVSARHAGPIHLLLTDVVMPGLSGRALAEQLAQVRPGLKVLFTSGYTDNAIMRHGVLEPGLAFLQKPFSPMTLALRVRQELDA